MTQDRSNPMSHVREARDVDAPAITALQVEAWRTAYSHFLPPSILNALSVEERTKTWKQILRSNTGNVLLAESAGNVVGFAHINPESDNNAELIRLYVHPSCWNSGIGTLLMNEAETRLKKQSISKLYCWVAEENHQARCFYEKRGFQHIPDRTRLDAFSVDGQPPVEVRDRNQAPDPSRGEFQEIYLLKSL